MILSEIGQKTLIGLCLLLLLTISAVLSPQVTWAAVFRLEPSWATIPIDGLIDVAVYVDTEGSKSASADAKLLFDDEVLEVVQIHDGDFYQKNSQFAQKGTLTIGGVNIGSPRSGRGKLTTITFRGRAMGVSSLRFACKAKTTTDLTNILNEDNVDLVDCVQLAAGIYTVAPKTFITPAASTSSANLAISASPITAKAPEASPISTPLPTITPTLAVKNTPLPTPLPTMETKSQNTWPWEKVVLGAGIVLLVAGGLIVAWPWVV